jgi:hypothetical protein
MANQTQHLFPRLLAAVVLVVSIAMIAPIGGAVITLLRGGAVRTELWLAPLLIMATGLALLVVLARPGVALRLYVTAFTLWLVTAGYFLLKFIPRADAGSGTASRPSAPSSR